MKTCGYCNNQYADNEPKCPVCGSTLLKHDQGSTAAEAEYDRIKTELAQKRRTRSIILIAGVVFVFVAIIVGVISLIGHLNSPERKVAEESNNMLSQAERLIYEGNYDQAYVVLDNIDPSWESYEKVDELRIKAVRKQLNETIAEYQKAGDYETVITFIHTHVADENADPEIKAIYDDAVRKYVAAIIEQVDAYLADGNYTLARSLIASAQFVVGDNTTLNMKLTELEKGSINDNIDGYLANDDYLGLVQYLTGIVGSNPDYQSSLNQYQQTLKEQTLAAADNYANNRQFADAIQKIKDVQGTYDCPEFYAAISEYEKHLPCALADCHVIDSEDATIGVTCVDCFGKEYDNAITFSEGLIDEDGGFAVFNLEGRFTRLSGCFIGSDQLFKDMEVSCKIYADGKLLYESPRLGRTSYPASIDLDISGTQQLRIEYMYYTWSTDKCCIFDLTVS